MWRAGITGEELAPDLDERSFTFFNRILDNAAARINSDDDFAGAPEALSLGSELKREFEAQMAAAVERFAADREAGAAQLANEGKQSVGASTDRAAIHSASAEPSAAGHVATGGADAELASVRAEPALAALLEASAASEPDEPTRSSSEPAAVGDAAVQADAGGDALLAAQVAAVVEPVDAGGVRTHSEAAASSGDAALEQADAADAAVEQAAAAPLVRDNAGPAAPPVADALAAATHGTAVPAALAADPVADGRDDVEPAATAAAELAPVARASASPDQVRVRGAGHDAAESEDEAALSAEDAQQAAAPAHTDLKDEAMLGEHEAKPSVQLAGGDSGGDGHIKDEATAVVAAAARNGTAHPPEAEAADRPPAVKSDAEGDAKSEPLTPRANGRLEPKDAAADATPKDEGKATGTAAKGYAGYRGEDGGGGGDGGVQYAHELMRAGDQAPGSHFRRAVFWHWSNLEYGCSANLDWVRFRSCAICFCAVYFRGNKGVTSYL